MKLKTIFVVLVLLSALNYHAAKRNTKSISISESTCSGLNMKIEHLNSKLRAGYKLKQGEVWKNQLRKFKKRKYACRMKRYSTR